MPVTAYTDMAKSSRGNKCLDTRVIVKMFGIYETGDAMDKQSLPRDAQCSQCLDAANVWREAENQPDIKNWVKRVK